MTELTWEQIRGWRLARQRLDARLPKRRMLDVVRELCGLHAQLGSSAELTLWARVDGVTPKDVRDALWERRTLVRTWAMRGTLHYLTADDLPRYVAALRLHGRWYQRAWLKYVGMTERELRALLDGIREALSDEPITREELAARVGHIVGPSAREHLMSGWGSLLKPAAFNGYLCSGPPRGQNVTFVRPDAWLGTWDEPDGQEAWREVVRRYLRVYGPSTHADFATWWGMDPPAGRRVFASVADDLVEVDVDGKKMWAHRADVAALRRAKPPTGSVRLLPAFDQYVVGFRPREPFIDDAFRPKVFRKSAWFSPVVLVDGRAAGVWRHERKSKRVQVVVEPFAKLAASARKAIGEEADRLGRFLDAPAGVSFRRV